MTIMIIYFPILIFAQEKCEKNIRFHNDLNWSQVKARAKAENKYIFVDCFTTWCGPCKRMDKETYSSPKVIEFFNSHFISVKVQFDSTDYDNHEISSWREEARNLMHKYSIEAFPTFLFFSPDGKIVHRSLGYKNEIAFLDLAENAMNQDEQYYVLLRKFDERKLGYEYMPKLAKQLFSSGQKEKAFDVADRYIEAYLLKLKNKYLYQANNIDFIAFYTRKTKSKAFSFFCDNSEDIDLVKGKGFSSGVITSSIIRAEIHPDVTINNLNILGLYWPTTFSKLKKQYGSEYSERSMLNAQIDWYYKSERWDELFECYIAKIDKYGMDTIGLGSTMINNSAFLMFSKSNHRNVLKKALDWMSIIVAEYPSNASFIDTYANLLYKLGYSENALAYEKKAAQLDPNDSSIKISFERMQTGQPTWLDERSQ